MPAQSQRPPAEALGWVEQNIGRGARVIACRRLTGGLTSAMHRLTVTRNGKREYCVLRRYTSDESWVHFSVQYEPEVLTALARSDIPAPRLVGSTMDAAFGGPSVLMTCLPGRVHLMPRDRDAWLLQAAKMLVRIHALPMKGRPFESWLDASKLSPPPDATRPDIWRAAIDLVAGKHEPAQTCFIHRDYQHFNLLWTRERLTGVVDWVWASDGPPEVDVAHCRLNLTLLFSADVADRFLEMYEREAGRRLDPWWDVSGLMSYGPDWGHFLPIQIGGRAPFDAKGMTRRMEGVLERTLRRL